MASLMQISRNSRQLFRILPFNLPFSLLDVSPPEKSCDLFRVKAFYLRISCKTRAEQRSAYGTQTPPSARFLSQPGDEKNTADSAMDEKPLPLPRPPVIASFTSVFIPRALPAKAQSLRTAFSLWRNGKNTGQTQKIFLWRSKSIRGRSASAKGIPSPNHRFLLRIESRMYGAGGEKRLTLPEACPSTILSGQSPRSHGRQTSSESPLPQNSQFQAEIYLFPSPFRTQTYCRTVCSFTGIRPDRRASYARAQAIWVAGVLP